MSGRKAKLARKLARLAPSVDTTAESLQSESVIDTQATVPVLTVMLLSNRPQLSASETRGGFLVSHEPQDPFAGMSELAQNAAQLHEVYTQQVEVGFTPIQSIYLVGCILTGSPGPAPDDSQSPAE